MFDLNVQIHPVGGDNAPGADADGRALRGVRAVAGRGPVRARGRRRRGQQRLQLHAHAVRAPPARRLRRQRLLRAAPAPRLLARLRRRPRQAHLQRGLRGPLIRGA